MGRPIRTFTVLPHLPERLQALQKLAYNMWWCWNHEAVALFRRIDGDAFEALDHSPVKLLGVVEPGPARRAARTTTASSPTWTASNRTSTTTWPPPPGIRRPTASGERRVASDADSGAHSPLAADFRIAYFSAEFGLHESVPVYSGGLGVLSGDHLKSASDLGLPLVGVGLMYREGYFRQYLTVDGWQQERYPENDFFNLPLIPEVTKDGTPLLVSVPFPGREVQVRVWRIQVGRMPLYLLDTNIPQNSPEDRTITARLYGGDVRHAHPPGDDPRRRRRPRPAGAGQAADRLPHERGPSRLLRPGAHPRPDGGDRRRFRRGPRGRRRRHRVHDAHAGPGRQRRLRAADGRALLLADPAAAEDRPRRVPRPGPAEPQRPQRAVRHDGAGPAAGQRRQRRQQAARRRLAQDVEEHLAGAARRRGADHLDHQRHPHAAAGCRRT